MPIDHQNIEFLLVMPEFLGREQNGKGLDLLRLQHRGQGPHRDKRNFSKLNILGFLFIVIFKVKHQFLPLVELHLPEIEFLLRSFQFGALALAVNVDHYYLKMHRIPSDPRF